MPQNSPTIVPNLYSDYIHWSHTLEPEAALAKAISNLLKQKKFAIYQCKESSIQKQDLPATTANQTVPAVSVTTTISTKEGKIGQITFTVNETTQEIETTYSNEILKQIFQPLFSPNYYIPQSAESRQNDLGFVNGAQNQFHTFYTRTESLQFAAKMEEIHHLSEEIKQNNAKLKEISDKNILKRGFLGRVQENERILNQLSEEEKMIAEINEIAQKEFFRTLPTYYLDPNQPENLKMLDQRFRILNHLSTILSDYSKKGTLPNRDKRDKRDKIDKLRLAVKALYQPNHHAESKTGRVVSAIGMIIGILAFTAAILLIVFAAPIFLAPVPLWLLIVFPTLLGGGLFTSVWSAGGFYGSFPAGVAKDLYFVADKMDAAFDREFPEGIEDSEFNKLGVSGGPSLGTDLTSRKTKVAGENFTGIYTKENSAGRQEKKETPEAKGLHTLLEAACKNLTQKEQQHLSNGLTALICAGEDVIDLEAVKQALEEAKNKKTDEARFIELCTALGVSDEIPEETMQFR